MKKVGLLALALYCGIIYTACGKEDTVYFEPDTQMESEEVTEAVLCRRLLVMYMSVVR